jgi:Small-conductance mechanosensitive channel
MSAGTLFGISGNLLAVGVIIAGFVVALLLYAIVGWLRGKAEETDTMLDDIILSAIGIPMVIAIMVISIYIALQVADLPEAYAWVVDSKYFNSIWIIIGAWIVSSFFYDILTIYGHRIAAKTETDMDDRMITLAQMAAKYIIWFAAIMLVLYTLEVDITPFLAGAGIVTLGITLALQDVLSNFFGGAIIAADKPFKIGDRVKIDEFYGDVISVGSRSTRIKTLDNQIVTVPNKKIVENFVINYAQPDTRLKVRIPVSVAYGTDVNKVKKIVLEIAWEQAEKLPYLLTDPEPLIFFLEFGASSLNFQMLVWTTDFSMTWDVQDAINTRIAERFEEEGIEIPFPQMDVHMRK